MCSLWKCDQTLVRLQRFCSDCRCSRLGCIKWTQMRVCFSSRDAGVGLGSTRPLKSKISPVLTALSVISNNWVASYAVKLEVFGCRRAARALARGPSFPGTQAQELPELLTHTSSGSLARAGAATQSIPEFSSSLMHRLHFQEFHPSGGPEPWWMLEPPRQQSPSKWHRV